MPTISTELYFCLWDVFYVLLGLLIEFAMFVVVLGVMIHMSNKFLDRMRGVAVSFCVTRWRDERNER
ncbi:MAG: hypothetical protein IJ418_13470 [Clostridia bacterium]|nr:hypothetical protein [Clostridia bacterium]